MIDRYSSLFGKYEFVVFQIQIQIIYQICTKVREKNWMFEKKICNHTFAL